MSETPWLTIVGVGEDGPDGLPPASRRALEAAEIVMGPARHLALR
ncbi:cobalamin biosynthesis bifunctional protein CbiET, partial [Rhodovulum sulfidophilum]|nr:cobalamin biosynthesis bifunctional protein CbiET [Rhodovulum sulfidophilum]